MASAAALLRCHLRSIDTFNASVNFMKESLRSSLQHTRYYTDGFFVHRDRYHKVVIEQIKLAHPFLPSRAQIIAPRMAHPAVSSSYLGPAPNSTIRVAQNTNLVALAGQNALELDLIAATYSAINSSRTSEVVAPNNVLNYDKNSVLSYQQTSRLAPNSQHAPLQNNSPVSAAPHIPSSAAPSDIQFSELNHSRLAAVNVSQTGFSMNSSSSFGHSTTDGTRGITAPAKAKALQPATANGRVIAAAPQSAAVNAAANGRVTAAVPQSAAANGRITAAAPQSVAVNGRVSAAVPQSTAANGRITTTATFQPANISTSAVSQPTLINKEAPSLLANLTRKSESEAAESVTKNTIINSPDTWGLFDDKFQILSDPGSVKRLVPYRTRLGALTSIEDLNNTRIVMRSITRLVGESLINFISRYKLSPDEMNTMNRALATTCSQVVNIFTPNQMRAFVNPSYSQAVITVKTLQTLPRENFVYRTINLAFKPDRKQSTFYTSDELSLLTIILPRVDNALSHMCRLAISSMGISKTSLAKTGSASATDSMTTHNAPISVDVSNADNTAKDIGKDSLSEGIDVETRKLGVTSALENETVSTKVATQIPTNALKAGTLIAAEREVPEELSYATEQRIVLNSGDLIQSNISEVPVTQSPTPPSEESHDLEKKVADPTPLTAGLSEITDKINNEQVEQGKGIDNILHNIDESCPNPIKSDEPIPKSVHKANDVLESLFNPLKLNVTEEKVNERLKYFGGDDDDDDDDSDSEDSEDLTSKIKTFQSLLASVREERLARDSHERTPTTSIASLVLPVPNTPITFGTKPVVI